MAAFVPAVEVLRDGDDVVVRVRASGDQRRPRRHDRCERTEAVLIRELRYGQFRREFALPVGVSAEQLEASYGKGLLDVRVRDVVQPEPSRVRVPIMTGGTPPAESGEPAGEGEREASA
jgi:HSP20 family protein